MACSGLAAGPTATRRPSGSRITATHPLIPAPVRVELVGRPVASGLAGLSGAAQQAALLLVQPAPNPRILTAVKRVFEAVCATGQTRQTALACSAWSRAGPVVPTGKNSSGSSPRQAARSRQPLPPGPGAGPPLTALIRREPQSRTAAWHERPRRPSATSTRSGSGCHFSR